VQGGNLLQEVSLTLIWTGYVEADEIDVTFIIGEGIAAGSTTWVGNPEDFVAADIPSITAPAYRLHDGWSVVVGSGTAQVFTNPTAFVNFIRGLNDGDIVVVTALYLPVVVERGVFPSEHFTQTIVDGVVTVNPRDDINWANIPQQTGHGDGANPLGLYIGFNIAYPFGTATISVAEIAPYPWVGAPASLDNPYWQRWQRIALWDIALGRYIPMAAYTNTFNIRAYDADGNLLQTIIFTFIWKGYVETSVYELNFVICHTLTGVHAGGVTGTFFTLINRRTTALGANGANTGIALRVFPAVDGADADDITWNVTSLYNGGMLAVNRGAVSIGGTSGVAGGTIFNITLAPSSAGLVRITADAFGSMAHFYVEILASAPRNNFFITDPVQLIERAGAYGAVNGVFMLANDIDFGHRTNWGAGTIDVWRANINGNGFQIRNITTAALAGQAFITEFHGIWGGGIEKTHWYNINISGVGLIGTAYDDAFFRNNIFEGSTSATNPRAGFLFGAVMSVGFQLQNSIFRIEFTNVVDIQAENNPAVIAGSWGSLGTNVSGVFVDSDRLGILETSIFINKTPSPQNALVAGMVNSGFRSQTELQEADRFDSSWNAAWMIEDAQDPVIRHAFSDIWS